MILCVCNALSERVIRDALALRSSESVGRLYHCLGCRVRCGKCIPLVAELARAARRDPSIIDRQGDVAAAMEPAGIAQEGAPVGVALLVAEPIAR
jgi:bacterioferritin-associated ferredoxin